MFATKDRGKEFSSKTEPAVESGKAKMSGMSRFSFPRVNGIEKKRKKWMGRSGSARKRGGLRGRKVEFEKEEGGRVWLRWDERRTEISRRASRVAFALEIRRADVGADQFGERPDTRYPDVRRLSPTITVSTNECNAVSQPLSPSLIYFDPPPSSRLFPRIHMDQLIKFQKA